MHEDATGRAPAEAGGGSDPLEVLRELTGSSTIGDRQWADAVLSELDRRIGDGTVIRRDPARVEDPERPGVLVPGGRWHVNLSAIRGRWPELALAALAAVVSRDPLAVAGALVSLRHTLTQLSEDEAEVAGTLARLGVDRGLPVTRAELEAAFAYDPGRDGEMPPGIRPIDAPAVIRELLRRGVLLEDGGTLAVQL
ncbi:MAG TPA: hypothetical protein VFY91_11215 [Microbacterium sp.]|nr:hypothetical protein [Microbacterium sp.]